MSLNVICLKYGTAYGAEYVNRLRKGILRNTSASLRMFCMTDDRAGIDPEVEILALPDEPYYPAMEQALQKARVQGRMRKISMFRPDLIPDLAGPLLVLDLDVIIVGDMLELAEYAPGKVAMRREWNAKPWQLGHGSVEKIEPQRHGYLYEDMLRDPAGSIALGSGSEQSYTSLKAQQYGDFQAFPDEWIASFKHDCRPMRPFNLILQPKKPPQAKVICFHGRPKMGEAVAGFKSDPLHSTRRAAWLAQAWSDEV